MQVLLGKLAKTLFFFVAAAAGLSAAGLDLTVLTVFSGALGLGLGFGLQKVLSNLASGFIMLMDRSVKPGDVIELGGTFGWITSIRARYVSVVTRDGAEYLIPNEHFITERVVNWSYSTRKIRLEVKFGVDYASDPHQVREVVAAAIKGIPRVLDHPAPVCHLVAFGELLARLRGPLLDLRSRGGDHQHQERGAAGHLGRPEAQRHRDPLSASDSVRRAAIQPDVPAPMGDEADAEPAAAGARPASRPERATSSR